MTNLWHVEVHTQGARENKSHRRTIRLEDRERTREQALEAVAARGARHVVRITQRCRETARHGRRCGRYTAAANERCRQHGGVL